MNNSNKDETNGVVIDKPFNPVIIATTINTDMINGSIESSLIVDSFSFIFFIITHSRNANIKTTISWVTTIVTNEKLLF